MSHIRELCSTVSFIQSPQIPCIPFDASHRIHGQSALVRKIVTTGKEEIAIMGN